MRALQRPEPGVRLTPSLRHFRQPFRENAVQASNLEVKGASPLEGRAGFQRWLLVVYGLLVIGFFVYFGWVLFHVGFKYSVLMNGWIPDVFELVVAALCLARCIDRRGGRAVALFLGLGFLSWGLGDTVWTYQLSFGTGPVSNFLGPTFWLAFYPLAYIAVLFFMRREVGALTTPGLLDGAVAALGTAAICSAFAFHDVLGASSTSMLTEATNLAYPIGDLLLLSLVIGCTAMLSGRRTGLWAMLIAAFMLNGVGDTFNLFQSSEGHYQLDAVFHAVAWPAAGLLVSIAVWLPARPLNTSARQKPTGFLLPGLATTAGLVILIIDTFHAIAPIAVGLAVATLITAGIRLIRSAQELRVFTEDRHHKSLTDELTGLANRRHLYEFLDTFFTEQADVRVPRRSLAFLFLDLNLFKEVNDYFGHLAGDELLKQLGPRLLRSLGRSDLLVRLGGDEFAVVLMDKGAENAASVAEQLTASLKEPFILKGVSASISASIGIAMSPNDAGDVSGLLQCADIAMYRAKLGHCPFAFFDPGLDVGNDWRLGDELRTAIERRQFVLYYQPQLDLTTGEVVGAEALVRWQHPKLGMLPPNKFLPLAEHASLMPSLTALLLDEAFTQAGVWRKAGHELTISANLSATNLLDRGFVDLLKHLLDHHRIPASAINLEITETSVIEHFEESKMIIEELSNLGFIVSIDDFGAGFTSLSYLSSLAVKELKLDCKLITGIAARERDRDRELVRSTVDLGHALGLRVIAEGVEDAATIDLVRELGADLAQGYFIGRPVLAEEIDLGARYSSLLPAGTDS